MNDEKEKKIPSVETYFPREGCHPESFRTDIFIKPSDALPRHKVRLIYCCPKDKWNPETGRCEDAMKLHSLIREEAPPESFPSSSGELQEIKAKLSELEAKFNEMMQMMSKKVSSRKKYDCEKLLEKGACNLEPIEKRAFVMCYLQKGLKEGMIKTRAEGMKKGWEEIRKCKD